jgi:protein-S-isoprenylcysteine O-methyltransferase Ste14
MNDSAPLASAGVRFPPPFVYALGILAGWLIDRRWRWSITGHPAPWRPVLAAALILAWFALFISAATRFRRAGTSIIPNKPVSAFVVNGPYQLSRNPMYVSLVALYLGVTLILNSWWPVLLLPVVLIVIDRTVIAREERYLRQRFPVEYPAYCSRVRRWL